MTADDCLPIECNWPVRAAILDECRVPPSAAWAARYEELGAALPLPAGSASAETFLGGVPAAMIAPAGHWPDTTVLYFHGGWYGAGSPRSHQGEAARLAGRVGSRLVLPGYRLAPDDPFPAAVEDAVSAYLGLLAFGTGPEQIVVAGDGAGGGLAIAMMLALRDGGVGLPAAALLFAPWADLSEGPARLPGAAARRFASAMASQYAGGTDPAHPLISPAHADLTGLPPLQVQVAADGVLRADGDQLAAAATAAGVRCEVLHWPPEPAPSAPPGWPSSAPDSAAAFTRSCCATAQAKGDSG
jgi:monoterpene epsilon-lactone hydrolase